MAVVTVDSSSKHLKLESIPLIDIRSLSQSELNSLSLCSNDAFDLRRCDDIVIPKIDRSVFNESAGSRKQTYSRLNFARPDSEITNIGRNRRFSPSSSSGSGLIPKHPLDSNTDVHDPEIKENQKIVTLLRELFAKDNPGTDLVPFRGQTDEEILQPEPLNAVNGFVAEEVNKNGERKRKRGRKRKDENYLYQKEKLHDSSKAIVEFNVQDRVLEVLNRKGEVIDLNVLGNSEDPFDPELKRRTVGLETDEQLLGFLRGIEGQWASTRKKRKIIDAGEFGDFLPNGWKVLLSLKRKEGRVWLHCRRYISPNGEQLVSMREVASNLCGNQDSNQSNAHHIAETCGANISASSSIAGPPHGDGRPKEDFSNHLPSPAAPLRIYEQKQVTPLRVENLAEVEVKVHLVCQKCNTIYYDKDEFLHHLLTSHQNKNKTRLCTTISDGVIIKDGKYECQFCHKIFEEKHRYNGHVGNHVKDYVKRFEGSQGKPAPKGMEASSLSVTTQVISQADEVVALNKASEKPVKANDELNMEAPYSLPIVDSVTESLDAKSNRDEMNLEALHHISVTEQGTPSAEPNSDEMGIEDPYTTPAMDSAPGDFNVKSSSTEMCVEAPYSTPAVDSVLGTSNAKYNPGETSFEAPRGTADIDSFPETSNTKSNSDENVEACHSSPVADSIPGTYNVKSVTDEMNIEAPYCKPGMGSVPENLNAKFGEDEVKGEANVVTSATVYNSGIYNPKPNSAELNEEAPIGEKTVTTVPRISHAFSDSDKVNLKAHRSLQVVSSIPDDTNVEVPLSKSVTDSLTRASNCKTSGDRMNVEAPRRTVMDFASGTFSAMSNHDEMNINAPHIRSVANSLRGASTSKSNYGEINFEAPQSTRLMDSSSGTFGAKSKYELNIGFADIEQDRGIFPQSFTTKPNDLTSHLKLDADSILEKSPAKSNCELHLAFPYNKQDERVNKMKVADESRDKPFGGYEIADDKLGEIYEPKNNYVTFNFCLDSASGLSNIEQKDTSKTSDGKYAFRAATSEIDKHGLEQEASFGSCWLTLSGGEQFNEASTSVNDVFSLCSKEPQFSEAKQSEYNEPKRSLGMPSKDALTSNIGITDEGNFVETMVANTSMEFVKSSNCFPTFSMFSDKEHEGAGFRSVAQKVEKVRDFEALKLYDMSPSKFTFGNTVGQGSNSMQEQPMDMTYDLESLGTHDQFDWASVLPNMETGQQFITTVCVWCGVEFNLDAIDPAIESGSVGFMCPSCKAKISGQLNYMGQ